jgi:hypothetical protein
MVMRKEKAAISAGHPAFSIMHTVCSPACVSLVSGSVVGSRGSDAHMGSVEPAGVVKRKGIPSVLIILTTWTLLR